MKFLLISQNAKNNYFTLLGKKLGYSPRSIKLQWATLRTLWNEKKVPNIPPLLVNNELMTEFEAKTNIFNKFSPASALQSIVTASFLRV